MKVLRPIATTLATTILMLQIAGADAAPSPSTVTITSATGDGEGVDIRGRVTSSPASCKRNRVVRVYHDVVPPGPGPEDFLLGDTRTNRKGNWRLSSSFLPDKVYARVLRRKAVCAVDTSPTKDVIFE
jgi:hypothetical protein